MEKGIYVKELYYDDISIAMNSKQQQLMKEADEYRFGKNIAAQQKLETSNTEQVHKNDRKYGIFHSGKPHGASAR
jgi:hypothetical protein